MYTYREYLKSEYVNKLAQPDWGVNVLNIGNYIRPTGKDYPDPGHRKAFKEVVGQYHLNLEVQKAYRMLTETDYRNEFYKTENHD